MVTGRQGHCLSLYCRAHKEVGATQAGAPLVGEIQEAQDEQRIAVIDLAGGPVRFCFSPDTWVYEYDWTPDGKALQPPPRVEMATRTGGSQVGGGRSRKATMRIIASPHFQMNCPRVSRMENLLSSSVD